MQNRQYKFTHDWFSNNEKNWRAILKFVNWNPNRVAKIIEIGSFEGRSTVWMLENLINHPDSRVYCVDSFQGGEEHGGISFEKVYDTFMHNIRQTGKAQQVEVIKNKSHLALASLISTLHEQIDFIYVDGSHQAPDVLSDLVFSFHLLKEGGLLICDDYLWRDGLNAMDVLDAPKIAIDSFSNIYFKKLDALSGITLYQVAYVKKITTIKKTAELTRTISMSYKIT